ncbi:MAG TPA: hypothetical protein VML75_24125, partial [Kofleriaceae bacterium]|nr:hypothetical protein [Kofleriaceae bacterium]
SVTGSAMQTPLAASAGSGGGGGGGGSAGDGGNGGGGGGVIELSAGGAVHLNAAVTALGGAGVAPSGSCTNQGGGGGGGSGGVMLVRAHGSVVGTGTPLSARGGPGGNGGLGCNAGGAASPGRIRLDSPSSAALGLVDAPAAVRGPMWTSSVPPITSSGTPSLGVHGQPSTTFGLSVNGGAAAAFATDATGAGTVTPSLQPGLNTICVLVSPTASNLLPEASNCRDIAYVP